MVERIFNKDHEENKKLFLDLKSSKKYSIYSTELNRVFGDKTYDKFYTGLLTHKQVKNNNFIKMFEKPVIKGKAGTPSKDEPFDIKHFKNSLDKMKIKAKEFEDKLKYKNKLRQSYFSQPQKDREKIEETTQEENKPKKVRIKKPYLPEVPDLGKYNPLYGILTKHKPQTWISKINFTDFNRNATKNISSRYTWLGANDEEDEDVNIDDINTKGSDLNYYLSKTVDQDKMYETLKTNKCINLRKTLKALSNKKCYKHIMTTIEDESKDEPTLFIEPKNNHCLNFLNYTSRKTMVNKVYYKDEKKNSVNPENCLLKYVKGSVDFTKVSSNPNVKSYFEEVAKSKKSPPLGLYRPKYNLVTNKTVDIFLDKKPKPPPQQMKLRKIIYRYDVPTMYQMVSELNDYSKPKDIL